MAGQDQLPCPNVPQDSVGLLGHNDTLWAHGHLVVHQGPQVLLYRAASHQVSPQPVLVLGITPLQVQDSLFALVRFQLVLLSPTLQPVKGLPKGCTPLCDIGQSSQLRFVSKPAGEAPAPSAKSLMNNLNNSGASNKLYGPPLVTGLKLEAVSVITALWDLSLRHFSVHCTVLSPRPHLL